MKKLAILMGAMALMAGFTACNNNGDDIDWDNMLEESFYITGEAVGLEGVQKVGMMAKGFNENGKKDRNGMYEKYVWLEANKPFELVHYEGQKAIRYGAELNEFNLTGLQDNPTDITPLRGTLIVGEAAPTLSVAETGMYHVFLDLNTENDLDARYIVVAPAKWGIRGGMNSWGTPTYAEAVVDGNVITYTWNDVMISSDKTYKFIHCDGWKINMNDAGTVKVETSFGAEDNETLGYVAEQYNLKVDRRGYYKIVLRYQMNGGAHSNSFTYTCERLRDLDVNYPEYLYMQDGGKWINMIPVNGKAGHFWAIRYLEANKGILFNAEPELDGNQYAQLGTATGYTVTDNKAVVAESKLSMIYVNYDEGSQSITIEPAAVYGMGDAFGSWDAKTYPATLSDDGKTVSITTTATGNLRLYAEFSGGLSDWWTREFMIYDGKIVYRGDGGDLKPDVAVTTGKVVTLDFTAGTGSIR